MNIVNTLVDAQTHVELYKQAKEFIVKEGGVIIPLFIHMFAVLKINCQGCKRHIREFRIGTQSAAYDLKLFNQT